jgi:hypothetical protein
VQGGKVVISDSVESFLEEGYAESDIIIPIDDDDILYPGVLEVPSLFSDPATNLVVWGRTTSVHGKERHERVHPLLDTNNWAIHGSYLQTWSEPKQAQMLSKHQCAHTEVGKRLGLIAKVAGVIGPDFFKTNNPMPALKHPSVLDLWERYHSVYYLHCGSISYLAYKVGSPRSIVEALKEVPLHPLFDEEVYQAIIDDSPRGYITA